MTDRNAGLHKSITRMCYTNNKCVIEHEKRVIQRENVVSNAKTWHPVPETWYSLPECRSNRWQIFVTVHSTLLPDFGSNNWRMLVTVHFIPFPAIAMKSPTVPSCSVSRS